MRPPISEATALHGDLGRMRVRTGTTLNFFLHGLGGERLMVYECTNSCGTLTEQERWIYFAGQKMFSKAGTGPLKAVTPSRLASEAKHFPYGELQGTAPTDTKDYFATYRRDGTGLDYAWNRYYSSTMARFTTADPYGGSVSPAVPETWNRYSYVSSNPVNYTDPKGLFLETYSGPGAAWIICAMNPFAAMSTNAGTCSNSGYSEEMWSIIGPWNPVFSEPILPPTFMAPQDARPQADWDKEIADIAGVIENSRDARTRNGGVQPYPRYLVVVEDCYQWSLGAAPNRLRTYAIMTQKPNPIPWIGTGIVTEQITVLSGSLGDGTYPGRWNPSKGVFTDHIGRGYSYGFTELQQFYIGTFSIRSFLSTFSYIPLIVVEKDGSEHGTLRVSAQGQIVDINGDGGKVPNCK